MLSLPDCCNAKKRDTKNFTAQVFGMVVCSREQWGCSDRREMNDASHDLHDSVTMATFVSQLEKDHLQKSSGYGRHLWFFK